ncbi:MAG: segregation/condensation protein A [Alphaproteobacteria bacterium]
MKLNLNISGYEGPLDLLLELSKKQKVDIKKISILELANQYLDFIDKNLNQIKLSADYLVTASLLAFLKSKLLLPEDQNDDSENIEEDLTNRLIHYDAIKKLAKKIFDLPQDGIDFHSVKISNEFTISSKIVPKTTLHDLILKYSELNRRKNSIKLISEESNLYTIEDGLKWLNKLFDKKEKNWLFLFNFLPKIFKRDVKYKSAIISLLLASLNKVSQGQIVINQKQHYDKIMVKLKNGS